MTFAHLGVSPHRFQSLFQWVSVCIFPSTPIRDDISSTTQFFLSMTTRSPRIPKDIKSLIPTQTPTWVAQRGNESSAKATWLGYVPGAIFLDNNQKQYFYSHACYFVELPTPPGAARGVRIIFDPVFSIRCSPSKWLGPARFTGKSPSPDTATKCRASHAYLRCAL